MPYDEGATLTNPETGQTATYKGGQWIVADRPAPAAPQEDQSAPVTASGLGKAAVSGLVHEGIGGLAGAPGDMRDLANRGTAWAVNKGREFFRSPQLSDLITGGPKPVTPENIQAASTSMPGPLGAITQALSHAPTSDEVKGQINKVAPEYEPQNFPEKAVKTTMGLVPGTVFAPESEGANLMVRALRSFGRYAAAPGVAAEGVRAVAPDEIGGVPVKEPLAMAAMLAAPSAATKLITPNPATAIQRAAGADLTAHGATFTPKQLAGGDLQGESNSMGFFGRKPVLSENANNSANYTRGAGHAAFADTLPDGPARDAVLASKEYTPQIRQQVNTAINNEFNRLTSAHELPPQVAQPKGPLDRVVKNYEQGMPLKPNGEPREMLDRIQQIFSTRQRGVTPGFISGRQYQNIRSDLSNAAADAGDPKVARTFRGMRDALDNSMDSMIQRYYPHDAGAFQRVRDAYQNNMIMDRAMGGTGGAPANYKITPDTLSSASKSVLGPDAFSMEQHPLARYARAGKQVLGDDLPMPQSTGLMHNAQLALTLGGGAGLGGGAEHILTGGGEHAIGYGLGAATAAGLYTPRAMVGALMNKVPGGRRYLANQALPAEAQPAFAKNPATAALMAELLARREKAAAVEQP